MNYQNPRRRAFEAAVASNRLRDDGIAYYISDRKHGVSHAEALNWYYRSRMNLRSTL